MPQSTHATPDQIDQTQNVQPDGNLSILQLARLNQSLQFQHNHDMSVLAAVNHKNDVLRTEKAQLNIDLRKCRAELDKRNAEPVTPQPKVCRLRLMTLIWSFASFMSFAVGFVMGSGQA